ncbi:MAG: hypothetical protein NC453_10630 [Muribaculum sp.]|nr:hypothetical protein [Muribaculum sp.]
MKKETTKKVVRKEFELLPLSEDFVMPVKAKRGSIGYDLTVPRDIVIPAHSRCKIPMDFAINLPLGTEAKIEPRSGCSLRGIKGIGLRKRNVLLFGFLPSPFKKKVLCTSNFDADVMVGKIDPNYTDNVHVLIKNNDEEFTLKAGTRIAQMTFYYTTSPFFRIVEKLSSKSRGGGFGSSGVDRIEPARKEYQAPKKEGGTTPTSVFPTSDQDVPPSTSNEPTE